MIRNDRKIGWNIEKIESVIYHQMPEMLLTNQSCLFEKFTIR